jgi:hypothetical protein
MISRHEVSGIRSSLKEHDREVVFNSSGE